MRAHHACLAALVMLAACGGGGAKMPPREAFPPTGQPALTKVLHPGANGRVLRMSTEAGVSDPMSAEVDLKATARSGDQRMEGAATSYLLVLNRLDSPPTEGDLLLVTTIEGANVEFHKAFEFTNLGLNPNEGLRGLSTTIAADARGRITNLSVGDGDVASSGVNEIGYDPHLLNGLATLPEEAVGVGAEWEAYGHLDSAGVKVPMVTRYKLLELDGDRVRLDVSFRASARDGDGLVETPDGVKLETFDLEGSGTLKLDLARPTRSEVGLTYRSEMDMTASGNDIEVKMDVRAKIGPRPM